MTDWYNEVSATSDKKTETKGTDWFSEMSPSGDKFKNLSSRRPEYFEEPGQIDRRNASPQIPISPGEENLPVVDNPEYGAGMGVHFKAGFADSAESIIPAAAKARFPNLPVEEAVKRYGVVDGQVVYQGDDGNLYREFPSQNFFPRSLKEAGQGAASSIGGLIPDVAGMVAGVSTAPALATPGGALASVRTVTGAQAGGEYVRQKIGQLMLDEPVDVGAIVNEGAQGAASQMLAGAITGGMNRFAAKDLYRADPAAIGSLESKAKKIDVPLTPAEKTNLPSLKSQQRALSNLPQSSDLMDDFYRGRGEKVSAAVGRELDTIAPELGGDASGVAARDAAGNIVSKMTAQRASQAKPLYEAAFKSSKRVDVKPVVSYINEEIKSGARGSIRSTLEKAREVLYVPGTNKIDTSVRGLHNAKMEIDNMISKASTDSSVGSVAKAKLVQVKESLVKQIELSSDDYAKARGLYADVSPGIDKVREGMIGVLSELKDDNLYKAGRIMLDPSRAGPTSVRNARSMFVASKNQESWNGILRSYLNEQFENAGREYATAGGAINQGAKFRAAMFGNTRQKEILRAAMGNDQFKSFSDLMDVLEATGRASRVGSDTAWNQEAMREMRRVSGGISRNLVAPHQIPARLRDWYEQVKLGNYAENLAKIVTSPEAMSKMRELRKVSPRTARATVIAADVLGILADDGLESSLGSRETRLPENYVSVEGKK
jgi:hypothetical protein